MVAQNASVNHNQTEFGYMWNCKQTNATSIATGKRKLVMNTLY